MPPWKRNEGRTGQQIGVESDTRRTYDSFGGVHVNLDASGTPDANVLYKGLIPKAWVDYTMAGTTAINDEENISSLTDNGTGDTTITIDRDFSSANFAWAACGEPSTDSRGVVFGERTGTRGVGTLRLLAFRIATTPAIATDDLTHADVIIFGRQA